MAKTLKILDRDPAYKYEGPRYKRLGSQSGEEFRDTYLIPWLQENAESNDLIVDFEGTIIFTPSFLEECFGGAIRKGYNVKALTLKNVPADVKTKIEKYIANAQRGK